MNKKEKLQERKNRAKENMGNIKKKIAVMSGKGGVGKTAIAVNLALALRSKGLNVGLLDVDIHGPNVPKMLGIENEKPSQKEGEILPITLEKKEGKALNVISMAFFLKKESPVIWRGPLKANAISQFLGDVAWGKLDFLIIDLPPGTGDEPLSIAQLIPNINGSVIVTTPQEVALSDARRAVNFSRELNVPVAGVIENMSGFECPHCGKEINMFKTGGGEKIAQEMGIPFLGKIPFDPKIVQGSDSGEPYLHHSSSETGKAFHDIVDKIKKFKS